jgi:hypothetical protein
VEANKQLLGVLKIAVKTPKPTVEATQTAVEALLSAVGIAQPSCDQHYQLLIQHS